MACNFLSHSSRVLTDTSLRNKMLQQPLRVPLVLSATRFSRFFRKFLRRGELRTFNTREKLHLEVPHSTDFRHSVRLPMTPACAAPPSCTPDAPTNLLQLRRKSEVSCFCTAVGSGFVRTAASYRVFEYKKFWQIGSLKSVRRSSCDEKS